MANIREPLIDKEDVLVKINDVKVVKYIYDTGSKEIVAPTLELANCYFESWILENTNYRGIGMYAKHKGYNLYYETADGKRYTYNGTVLYEADEYGNLTRTASSVSLTDSPMD